MSSKILVIDSDKDSRSLLCEGLSNFLGLDGYEGVPASSAGSGIAAARELRPALIVMAFDGSRLDGLKAFKRVKDYAAAARIPVLVLRNDDSEAGEEFFLDQGAPSRLWWKIEKRSLWLGKEKAG